MRLRTLLAVAGSSVLLLSSGSAALAATPESGDLTTEKRDLKWTGEAAGYLVSLFPDRTVEYCSAPFCDTYTFTVPEGLPARSHIDLTVTAHESSGFTDVFVTDPLGDRVWWEGQDGEPATTARYDDPAPGTYTVQTFTNAPVVLTTGSYSGRVKLTLPPPPAAE